MSCTECLRLKIKQLGICGFLFAAGYYGSVVCQTAAAGCDRLVYAVVHGICDLSDGSVLYLLIRGIGLSRYWQRFSGYFMWQ